MNQQKIIITGINGFVGKHLTRELVQNNIEVIGIGREETIDQEIKDLVKKYICRDIAKDWPHLDEDIHAIINLAGLAAVGPSFEHPQDYISINSAIVTNMCEYYIKQDKRPRILSVVSGAIYSPHQAMPLTENSELSLNSPYVVSKILNERQLDYYRSRGLDCIAVRPFNHIGPGQGTGFLIPDLIEKIAEAKETGVIAVGNLNTRRDYTDVRDVAHSYYLLATTEKLNNTTYNVCSGKSVSGKEMLGMLCKIMNIDVTDLTINIDEAKIRPNDPMDIYGDYTLISEDTGWKPQISLETTLRDCVESLQFG